MSLSRFSLIPGSSQSCNSASAHSPKFALCFWAKLLCWVPLVSCNINNWQALVSCLLLQCYCPELWLLPVAILWRSRLFSWVWASNAVSASSANPAVNPFICINSYMLFNDLCIVCIHSRILFAFSHALSLFIPLACPRVRCVQPCQHSCSWHHKRRHACVHVNASNSNDNGSSQCCRKWRNQPAWKLVFMLQCNEDHLSP